MTTLHTRLHGSRVAVRQVPTGFGPSVWVGELRSEDHQPLWTHSQRPHTTNTLVQEVRVAPDLGELLVVLERLASAQSRPGYGRNPASQGHLQGKNGGCWVARAR